MKLPVEWLSDFVEAGASTDELAKALTMAGLEVEGVSEYTPDQLASQGGAPKPPAGAVFDTKVTPNRGDWLSVIGVAREAAAISGKELKVPVPAADGTPPPTSSAIRITIQAPDLCRRYAGGLVRGVKIAESPGWLKNRLIMAGMRPINNVVDITNYVMIEYGQPLHAFDYRLLRGAEIIVRRANSGEMITTIDGQERRLERDMLVIADRDRAVAIAGVMGGSDSEVSPNTSEVLIESANFDPVSVRKTSKTLGLLTESSYRFERIVDPSVTVIALKRAAELMRDLAGGEIAQGVVDVYPSEVKPVDIRLRPDRVNRVLGSDLKPVDMARLLQGLGFDARLNGAIEVTVPTFRPDVVEEIDLIEEIARLHGFDKVGATLPESATAHGVECSEVRFEGKLRQILMRCGGQEVLTHSMVDPSLVEMTGMANCAAVIRNPLSEDLSRLRIALVPSLLQVLSRNAAFGVRDLFVFEIGRVYRRVEDGSISQNRRAAGAMMGTQWKNAWDVDESSLSADFFLCKGVVEAALDSLGIDDREFTPTQSPMLHPTRVAAVRSGRLEIGLLGEVADSVRDNLKLRGRACAFELDFEALRMLQREAVGYEPIARYPSVYRDLSIVVSEDTPYARVREVILRAGGELIESVELQEVYAGPQVGPGRKSLLLSVAFRSRERTLTDELVSGQLERVTRGLKEELSAGIRGG